MLLRLSSLLHANYMPFCCEWAESFRARKAPPRPLPSLPLEIWLEIFQFATHVSGSTTIEPTDPFVVRGAMNIIETNTPSTAMRTKCVLVSVSRTWRRMSLGILFQHIVIRSPLRATLVLRTLRDQPEHGYWTRHIEVYTHARRSNDIRFLQDVYRIFQFCPRLRYLTASWRFALPKEFVVAVAGWYGPTLQGLYWDDHQYAVPGGNHVGMSFLGAFKAIHTLDMRNFAGTADLPTPTLPSVKHLVLSNRGPNIALATHMVLPALHTLTLHTLVDGRQPDSELLTKLLKIHGASLMTVHLPAPITNNNSEPASTTPRSSTLHPPPGVFLRNCPNLDTISFSANSPLMAERDVDPAHPTLRRVAIYSVRCEKLAPYPKPAKPKPTSTVPVLAKPASTPNGDHRQRELSKPAPQPLRQPLPPEAAPTTRRVAPPRTHARRVPFPRDDPYRGVHGCRGR
ncbi:hypothetical protein HMN09_00736500 [Mycena chlorophos]|uniref:F-box domain-containing protein n=1 Tax=Mycena chlorophos TaxID=658473 RepID=A0A8H6STG2_MYCCL|nr:hypothetical protein HMN09_00736500 [Mycena chlorophos]